MILLVYYSYLQNTYIRAVGFEENKGENFKLVQ